MPRNMSKIIWRLTVQDFLNHPVWRFENIDGKHQDDRRVRPVLNLPTRSLTGCLVGTQVQLADGSNRWAVLSNITVTNPRKSKHFLTAWIENQGKWFELARYFDVDYTRRGAQQVAVFMNKLVDDVFPISYDISLLAEGDVDALAGRIEKESKEQLTGDEIIALTLSDD
jgi:hypothetical protein